MSSTGYATPLRLEVTGNPFLQRLFLLLLGAASLTLLLTSFRHPPLLVLIPLIIWLARREWRRRPELGGDPLSLVWDHEQRWWCRSDKDLHELGLLGDSYLSPHVVVLNFHRLPRHDGFALVLTPKGVGRDNFRHLLVRLRLSGEDIVWGHENE